jgi:hypothetical protein
MTKWDSGSFPRRWIERTSCILEEGVEEFNKKRYTALAVSKRTGEMLTTAWMNGKNRISLIGS